MTYEPTHLNMTPDTGILHTRKYLFAGACLLGMVAASAVPAQEAGSLNTTRTTWMLSDETWKLPGNETMGMVGGNLLFGVTEKLKLGVASYGAVRGNRGGFITLGATGEFEQPLTSGWSAQAGMFVGAGGGRGGRALAGGGLMLRANLGLSYDTGRYGKLGFGFSHVKFPSGVISSTQPYLRYDYSFNTLIASGWQPLSRSGESSPRSLLASRQQDFAIIARSYRIPGGVVRDDGTPQYPRMQLVGAEWTSYLDDRWFLKLESEGAMGGKSNGYMQILVGGGYRLPIWQGGAIKLHAAAGPAGGGAVDTGGGMLFDAGVALQQRIGPRNSLEFSLGKVAAPSRSFEATSLGIKLVHHFSMPAVGPEAVSRSALNNFDAQNLRLRLVNQTYSKAASNWRCCFPELDVQNLGVQLDYFLTPPDRSTQWFLTGQGLAAYKGEAGAYMTGLLGAGVRQNLTDRWFTEGEALIGAAGGGGLAVGGGLVGQVNAGIGYRLSKSLSVMTTLGYMGAPRGDFRAKVVGLSLAYDFATFGEARR